MGNRKDLTPNVDVTMKDSEVKVIAAIFAPEYDNVDAMLDIKTIDDIESVR